MNGDVSIQSAQNCLTMAAGSDRQPIESSVVPVCGKPTTNPLTRLPTVRNIPYSDHNYGKPLTPPDSCSPDHPEEADTGNEDEGFTRCICGFKHDDGYMICCDRCSAWQHVECVGIKSNCVPDTYLCDMCDPRPLDKKRAIQIQTKKLEEPTDEEDDDDGDVSDHDSDNGISRQSLSNSVVMKENVLTKGKRKKRESTRKLNQKEMKHNKRKRRKKKHISSTDTIPVDEETNGPWPIPDHKNYEEAQKTVYIGDWENCSVPSVEPNASPNNVLRPEQICKVVDVQKNKKGVVVTEDIDGNQFIIECKGNLMLESKFREDHPMFSKCDPFVLYYTKLELVMNFSLYGNDARFIRRSCSPTAEVRHVTVENKPHLFVYSLTPLAKGTEVTLAFEFPFHEYRRPLECACAQDGCTVQKHNATIQRIEQTNGYRSKDEHGLVDSSLSNHMDSDSEGDNNTKDKRSRKKMSREDRKLQQYLRQFEKMEKTEKKKQQHTNGRDARTGILTQRNYPDEYNGETPSKNAGKGLRKPGLSQRPQRKLQSAIRRAHRLPSCSSEPLSPEDNYSSAASTPTTPCVNAIEENIEHHHLQHHHPETPEKSFKFPKGSMTDLTSSSIDASQSNNPSPEAPGYSRIPSSVCMLESRLVEVDEHSCDRLNNLHAAINGGLSPTTDPNCSPSPCHSTYASPTHSESVDLNDMLSRHQPTSPAGSSVASFTLNSGMYRSNPTYTTLKKRWLLQYAKERPVKRLPPNGVITTNVYRPSEISRVAFPSRTFPLPYKRRKLMEYQKSVNNPSSEQNVNTTSQTTTDKSLPNSEVTVSSINTSTSPPSILSAITSSTSPSSTSSVTSAISLPMASSVMSSVPTTSMTSLNNFSLASTNNVRLTMLSSTRTTTSGGLTVTGSNDAVFSRVTGSEDVSWRRRTSGGSDDASVGRSSLSSISSTDDVKMDATATSSNSAKNEPNLGNEVGSSSEANRKPPASQAVQENLLESSTGCVTRDDTSKDKTTHVGSSGVVEGSGATSTTQTTPGGKKKVSLTEYLSRKRTTGSTVKKEAAPGPSSDVTSASQSRVSETGSQLASSEPVVNYRGNLGTSVSTSGYTSTLLSSSGVSSSTSGIEPVSPEEGYRVDDDRPSLSSNAHGSQSSSTVVEREVKPSLAPSSYRNFSQNLRPLSEPGSSSDAMDIDDDDTPSSSTIVVNTPVMSLPGASPVGVTSSNIVSSLANVSYSNIGQPMKFTTVTSAQPLPGRQVTNSIVAPQNAVRQPVPVSQVPNTSLQPLPRHPDIRSANSRPSPFH